ncbi:AraC family transcriptional regulator [Mycolicibacterium phlei]|uniref:AraC family transcriptional regulator n=1 Tax=Mycolicibacterium phlei DSM 43239 = CCUG 21000 TaxID=1226750 RepID=A0A5N5VCM9_MYCPH|nr:helix-turn-helix domain-containing protein [Mycolicibacterium phlei]VEG11757.1 AraC family transcriptional regulator [Mycobacteroides chelonae]AMO63664.1 Helix-turn-helix domain protein [Mycolicibacterium phlei]KAB7759506.1 AraC family transcriptional regulator [Mycolicibacterium phlei DSM 43239 = CCUG 21000]KXW60118.1 AraC family transcriptional regulator [Mycolicibacterium phlei DSM 43072]KXW68548.1 AraC family transcriptional regulator [Mycolicibacterium phlei DSM 43239 = CCUG 21000]
MDVTPGPRRDRLRELLDAVVAAGSAGVGDMARRSHASEFHFSREVRRLAGEPPAALRRRIMLERAAWRLQRGEKVSAVAADEGWSSTEVFSRAFRRTFGVPPSRAADVAFRVPAPNGLHFHPPASLWLDGAGDMKQPDVSQLMVAHDVADTGHLLEQARALTDEQWRQEISPGRVVLPWDGPETSVGDVLGAIVWTKQVWLATIEGRDFPDRTPTRAAVSTPARLAAHHDEIGARWTQMVAQYSADGRLGDIVIDALCDPPESFQLYGIIAHVLTYAAHRRLLVRGMLARHGVQTDFGDPLEWMRGN